MLLSCQVHIQVPRPNLEATSRRPDGKHLSFAAFVGKYPQLFVVAAAGGDPRQLTRLDGAVTFAFWKPG